MSTPLRVTVLAAVLAVAAVLSVSCGERAPGHTAETSSSAPQENFPAAMKWQEIGSSVLGRPIRTLTLGHGRRNVLFVGGIHGDEQEGSYATESLPSAFEAAGLGEKVSLTVLEDLNPDGRAASTRFNANGVDINRNFPAANFQPSGPSSGGAPLSQPESRLLFDLINRVKPALVIVIHSWTGRQFVNYDGPARPIAERFAQESGMPITPSTDFSPTPGSLGSYFGRDRNIAILTIEFLKGSDPKKDWEMVKSAMLNAIAG